ncbi:hypothetical protein B0H14DRAFT_3475601 [Mycena olivaceomarginata]|nr:hypothetical protein B0H14DRAFT_3475601 [Mycena olivaceomarginata]
MLFAFRSRVLSVALLCFSLSAHAASHYTPNDMHCPAESHPTFVHNSYTYNAPVDKFTNLTKSFFELKWYAGAIVSNTTGTDNVPGATRSGPLGGTAVFNETLTMYSMHPDEFTFSFHGAPYVFGGQNVTAYAETMRFEGICSGKATYIDVITYLCSNDSIAVYDATYTAHMVSFQGLATSVGATVMARDCPCEWLVVFRDVELMGYAVQKSQYVKANQEGVLFNPAS